MRAARFAMWGVIVLVPSLWGSQREPAAVRVQAVPGTDDTSCAVCHPGPTKALRRSPHGFVAGREQACTICHVGAAAHAAAAMDPAIPAVVAPAVGAASCASCHDGAQLSPSLAAHAWSRQAAVPQVPAVAVEDEPLHPMDWAGLVTTGFRFLDRGGSNDRYDTDVDLDRGFVLAELELEGRGSGGAWADLVRFRADDIGDPHQRVEGLVEKSGSYRGRAAFEKSTIKYRTSGDFHRIDRKSQQTVFELSVEPASNLEVFASTTRTARDGFWLTSRIGNRNLNPLSNVSGVASPREYDSDLTETGLTTTVLDTALTVAVEYREDSQRDRWSYSRLFNGNTETESFLSRSSTRGPGARFALSRDVEGISIDLSGRVLDLDRRNLGSGTRTGTDIGSFVTTTRGVSTGGAQTWVLESTVSSELGERAALTVDLRWVDHEEQLGIQQSDVTVYPVLATQTSVATVRTQRTTQRMFDGSVYLDVEPTEGLELSAGYGWAREQLRVPDLVAGDNDFVSGTIRDEGVLLGAEWRPDAHWTLGVDYKFFGQSRPHLTELAARDGRGVSARVRYKADQRFWAEVFASNRQRENDLSRSRYESISSGVTLSATPRDGLDVHGSYVFSEIQARTLTNFYFNPGPVQSAAVVGFEGETHTLIGGVQVRPSDRIRWSFDGVFTGTNGSFDIDLIDWEADLASVVSQGGELGVTVRSIDYEEAGNRDDFDALVTFVYWRQRLGGQRP